MALRYKDYTNHNRHKTLHFDGEDFFRRYLRHLLPKGFTRMRHYGFLAGCCREQRLAQTREALAVAQAAMRAPVRRAMHAITAVCCARQDI